MVDYWLAAGVCLCGVHIAEEIQLGLGITVSRNDRLGWRVQPVNATLLVVYRQAFQSEGLLGTLIEAQGDPV